MLNKSFSLKSDSNLEKLIVGLLQIKGIQIKTRRKYTFKSQSKSWKLQQFSQRQQALILQLFSTTLVSLILKTINLEMQSINTHKLSKKRTQVGNKSSLSITKIEAWLNIILVTWLMPWKIISKRFFWTLTMLTTISTEAMCIYTRLDSLRNMRNTLRLMRTLIQLLALTLIMQRITMRKGWYQEQSEELCQEPEKFDQKNAYI